MTLYFLLFFIFILTSVRKCNGYNEEYLSIRNTNIIKGIFIFFVFIRHFIPYDYILDIPHLNGKGLYLDSKSGQLLVCMFLFYSGYGVSEAIKRKGHDYVMGIPKKRILPTVIRFDIAVIIYYFYSNLFLDKGYDSERLIEGLTGWESVGNSNWYIFCIVFLYLITYLSFMAFDKNKAVIAVLVGVILYTQLMLEFRFQYWANTSFCYVFGVFYSVNKEKIENFSKNKLPIIFVYALILFRIAYELKVELFWYDIHTICFTIIILVITRKIKLKNRILEWMGKNLFYLYIYQRIFMVSYVRIPLLKENGEIAFLLCVLSTVALTIIMNYLEKSVIYLIGKAKNSTLIKHEINN